MPVKQEAPQSEPIFQEAMNLVKTIIDLEPPDVKEPLVNEFEGSTSFYLKPSEALILLIAVSRIKPSSIPPREGNPETWKNLLSRANQVREIFETHHSYLGYAKLEVIDSGQKTPYNGQALRFAISANDPGQISDFMLALDEADQLFFKPTTSMYEPLRQTQVTGEAFHPFLKGLNKIKSLRQQLGIDPYEIHEGPLPEEFARFNAFFALSEEKQPTFLEGLEHTAEMLPFEIQSISSTATKGLNEQRILDLAYEAMANDYAEMLDPEYRAKKRSGVETDPKVDELQGIFYRMINGLSAYQIKQATEAIGQHITSDQNLPQE